MIICQLCCYKQAAKKELLGQDFEGVLKYFRVHLPKRYRTEENAQELMHSAMSTKVRRKQTGMPGNLFSMVCIQKRVRPRQLKFKPGLSQFYFFPKETFILISK